MFCIVNVKCHKKSEPVMNLIKLFITALLLVFSSQSLALFMPADSKVNTDEAAVSNNVGC